MGTDAPNLQSPSQPAKQTNRRLLLAIFLIALGWIGFILFMVIWYSNPVTLNELQILSSTQIAAGRVIGPHTITRDEAAGVWPFEGRDQIEIVNLAATPAKQGETYVFPLIPFLQDGRPVEGAYEITPTRLPGELPLIYPTGEETTRQLKKILLNQRQP